MRCNCRCKKLLKTKAFNGEEGGKAWEADVVAKGYELMLVSQFTLHGRLKKPKPDFSKAMPPQAAKEFYNNFVQRVRAEYGQPSRVKDGVFGAMMDVALVNAGPVTFILDSDAEGGAGGPSEQWTQPAL